MPASVILFTEPLLFHEVASNRSTLLLEALTLKPLRQELIKENRTFYSSSHPLLMKPAEVAAFVGNHPRPLLRAASGIMGHNPREFYPQPALGDSI